MLIKNSRKEEHPSERWKRLRDVRGEDDGEALQSIHQQTDENLTGELVRKAGMMIIVTEC